MVLEGILRPALTEAAAAAGKALLDGLTKALVTLQLQTEMQNDYEIFRKDGL